MTDTRRKAQAMLNAVREEYPNPDDYLVTQTALCRAIEQHEAFRQEVSDAMEEYCELWAPHFPPVLNQFIIPKYKPDPLVEVMKTFGSVSNAEDFRAALDALGFEIRSKNDD
jgi:hypothetical protein